MRLSDFREEPLLQTKRKRNVKNSIYLEAN
ncbi:hypothetical protein ES319_D08G073300v1 [Gossypium barbadense]|uniref:Uncharacterized protein n=1 Tax=Gossypium barbadense TaxID=3634 RepID=A0A5J5QCS8_GOSBA|nr:hypothetical protein ES319_D08G073300v1 [Gossypium barbadense]